MNRALAAIGVAGVAGATGCAGVDAPVLDQVTPASARAGAQVVVTGAGFCVPDCDGSPAGTVTFGIEIPQVRAVVTSWDERAIAVIVPQSVEVGPTDLIVTVNDRSSNALAFAVLP